MIGRARAALGTRGNRQDPRAAVVGPDCHPATKPRSTEWIGGGGVSEWGKCLL